MAMVADSTTAIGVSAGHRLDNPAKGWWAGTGSNRRPSAFEATVEDDVGRLTVVGTAVSNESSSQAGEQSQTPADFSGSSTRTRTTPTRVPLRTRNA